MLALVGCELLLIATSCIHKRSSTNNTGYITGANSFNLTAAELKSLMAASSTNADACMRISQFYGLCHADTKRSMIWLRMAAEKGNPQAQYNMAVLETYMTGYVNLTDSDYWLQKAVDQGYPAAVEMMGKKSQH
jgi:TPR repeat protein